MTAGEKALVGAGAGGPGCEQEDLDVEVGTMDLRKSLGSCKRRWGWDLVTAGENTWVGGP